MAASQVQADTGRGQGQERGGRKEAPREAGSGTREDVMGASDRYSFQSPGVSINNRLPGLGPGGRSEEGGEGRVIWGLDGEGWDGVGGRLPGTHRSPLPGARVGGGEGAEPTGC